MCVNRKENVGVTRIQTQGLCDGKEIENGSVLEEKKWTKGMQCTCFVVTKYSCKNGSNNKGVIVKTDILYAILH